MKYESQDRVPVEITRKPFKNTCKETVEIRTYVADALSLLLEAGRHGVHISEIRADTLARLDQIGLRYDVFESSSRGGGRVWVRLNLPEGYGVQFLNGEAH